MAVVGFGRPLGLGPLPAHESHEVRILRLSRERVALPDALLGLIPAFRSQALGVIVDREKVEGRTMAGEVAGVCKGMGALPPEQRQGEDEGVDRIRGVNMKITEENALGPRRRRGALSDGTRHVQAPGTTPTLDRPRRIAIVAGRQRRDENEHDAKATSKKRPRRSRHATWSTIFPKCSLASISLWASATSSSGITRSTMGRMLPFSREAPNRR